MDMSHFVWNEIRLKDDADHDNNCDDDDDGFHYN